MKTFLLAVVAVVLLLTQSVQAQDVPLLPATNAPVQRAPAQAAFQNLVAPQQPIGPPVRVVQITFGNLALAKIDENDGQQQIIFMLEAFRTQKQEIPLTAMKEELRIVQITQADGKVVEKKETVQVPVTSMRWVDSRVSVGLKPKAVPLDDFQFLDVDSKPVSKEDAAKILSTLKPVFLVEGIAVELLPPIGAMEKQVLRPDVLYVVTKKTIRENRTTPMMYATPTGIIPEVEEEKLLGVPELPLPAIKRR